MFCTNCGKEIAESAKVCEYCGVPVSNGNHRQENGSQQNHRQENESQQNNGQMAGSGRANGYPGNSKAPVNANRSLPMYILLSIVTCGIYSYYFLYKLAADVNIICDGDGKETPGLLKLILLSLVTCGIYSYYWYYALGNRLAENAPRYGMSFTENGTTVLLWRLFGVLICGIGPFIAMHIVIKNTNALAGAYLSR